MSCEPQVRTVKEGRSPVVMVRFNLKTLIWRATAKVIRKYIARYLVLIQVQ